MSFGLQIMDQSGEVMVDSSTALRYVTQFWASPPSPCGSWMGAFYYYFTVPYTTHLLVQTQNYPPMTARLIDNYTVEVSTTAGSCFYDATTVICYRNN
jgi:hypothetical protein